MRLDGPYELEITPTEFERQVKRWLEGTEGKLVNFEVTHHQFLPGPSGEFEIDVVVEFEVLGGAVIKILVECKRYKDPIKRDVVMLLKAKLDEIGAHKGMVFSTAQFQSGALEYAKTHGIATVIVQDGHAAYQTRAMGGGPSKPPPGYPEYKFTGWVVTKGKSYHLLADDYPDALNEWLYPKGK